METPEESFSLAGEFFQEALAKSDSFDSIRSAVSDAINANIMAGIDMDGDDDGPQDAIEGAYAWVCDIFPAQVVYSMGGTLFQCDYEIDSDGDVQLGDPLEVETSYTPVEDDDDDSTDDDAQESFRVLACSAVRLEESAYDAATGKLNLTVIKPGLNKSKSRFYPQETLKRDYKVFENAKMFLDHQSEKESKDRPEGSVNNYVAQITKVWPEADGTIKATAAVIDPPFKAKLAEMHKQGLLHEMGVSIRAIGEASEQEKDGVTTNVVESLIAARSVDFVTYAGAGGQIEAMESDSSKNNENDVDLVTEAALRKRRPDLVALIETHSQEKLASMKTIEQQLAESQTQLTTLTKENTELKTKFGEAQKVAAKASVAAELTKQLAESKLPDFAQARLRKQFEAAEATAEQIKEAIVSEQDYLKKAGIKTVTPKNLGAADNGTTNESGDVKKPNLEEAFALLPGMSKEDAKFAARV
jgi:hypothetical protein